MSAQTRFVTLLALCCLGPATAQAAGRAWTDPPARSAVAAPVPQPAPEAPTAVETPTHAAGPSSRIRVAVTRRPPGSTGRTLASTRSEARNAPGRIAHARMIPARVAPAQISRTRVAQARGGMPARTRASSVRPVRYGFLAPPSPSDLYGEDPSLRRAEAAGYLVMHRSAFTTQDGRIPYGYRPYDPYDY